MRGLDVQAEDMIDFIEGYKGKGYAISSKEELGKCLILFWIIEFVTLQKCTQLIMSSIVLLYANFF